MTELADEQAAEHQEPLENAVIETPEKIEAPKSIRENIEAAVKEARARDEKTGQFTKTAGSGGGSSTKNVGTAGGSAPEKVAAADWNAEPKVSEAQPEPSAAVSTPSAPPPGWSKESKDFFNSLPADHPLRKDIAKREEEVSSGFKKYGDVAKRHEEIEQVLGPRRAGYQQHGLTDAQAINSLLQWEETFRNPATRTTAFQNLARAWNFDLSTLAQPSQQAQGDNELPAQLRPVLDQFGNISQTVQQIQQRLDQTDAQRMQAEINAFSQGKPHFETVRVLMGQLLNGGAATTMDDAYQQAIKLHPEVSQLVAKEAADKAEAERKKAAEDKARAAAAASASVRGSPPQGEVANAKKPNTASSVRDSLKQAIAEVRA